jgi:hypothetical protein
MDSLSTTIAELRAALATVNALAAKVEEAVGAAAALPPPPPVKALATPANFGNAEANAQHYLSGKSLYEPSQELLEAEANACEKWREADILQMIVGPSTREAARADERRARDKMIAAEEAVRNANKQKERYQAFYDGTYTKGNFVSFNGYNHPVYVYRFYVFRIPEDGKYWLTKDWTPVGLLNPHAYFAAKENKLGWKTVLDFVDAGQPAPALPAKMGGREVDMDADNEEKHDEEEHDKEKNYVFCARCDVAH